MIAPESPTPSYIHRQKPNKGSAWKTCPIQSCFSDDDEIREILRRILGAGGVCPDRVVTKTTPWGGFNTPTRKGGV